MTTRLPKMVMFHDTRFVECRWWNDGWTVKTVVTGGSSAPGVSAKEERSVGLTLGRTLLLITTDRSK